MKKILLILLLVAPFVKGQEEVNAPCKSWMSSVYTTYTVMPSPQSIAFSNDFIQNETNNGNWAHIVTCFSFWQDAKLPTQISLDATHSNMTAVNGFQFVAYKGWKGDGSTSYGNTNATLGGVYTQNNAMIALFRDTAFSAGSNYDYGTSGSNSAWVIAQFGTTCFLSINGAFPSTYSTLTLSSFLGLCVQTRSSSTICGLWFNGVNQGFGVQASSALPGNAMYLDARNTGGTGANFLNTRESLYITGDTIVNQVNLYTDANRYHQLEGNK